MKQILDSFIQGERLALSRLISVVEAHPQCKNEIFNAIAQLQSQIQEVSKTHFLGVTGPPGAGKSTLVNALIKEIRARDQTVGVVAVDPSSPISGGALLGDRIRMQEHASDPGVFIRSLSSRGHHGGLSRSAEAVAQLMQAFGFDWVILETVGVGQSECEIVRLAETTLVVLTPESGDTVQSLKAGLMEMADIFVVNKADRAEAAKRVAQIQVMLDLGQFLTWRPPILLTQALNGTGIAELLQAIQKHQEFVRQNSATPALRLHRQKATEENFKEILKENFYLWLQEQASLQKLYQQSLSKIQAGTLSPEAAVQEILQRLKF